MLKGIIESKIIKTVMTYGRNCNFIAIINVRTERRICNQAMKNSAN